MRPAPRRTAGGVHRLPSPLAELLPLVLLAAPLADPPARADPTTERERETGRPRALSSGRLGG